MALLSVDPPVFKTGIAYDEFLGVATAFGQWYGDVAAGFIIYPTWSIEEKHRAAVIAAAAAEHRNRFPNHRLLYICNTQREADVLNLAGQPAVFLNKNFTVSDAIFRPLAQTPIEFDAVYNARFVPSKRHDLASGIERVAYISYAEGTEQRMDQQRQLLAATLARHRTHTLLNPMDNGLPVRLTQQVVNAEINRAAVGLCLSEIEGSNYASMEYMLAGLPVVSTPSKGGRDVYFDPDCSLICEPDPAAVRDAVEALIARKLPPEFVRGRALARIEPQRRRFLTLVDEMIADLGGKPRFGGPWPFGEVSGMVTWAMFDDHLRAFDRIASSAIVNGANGVAAPIADPADFEGIQLRSNELAPIVKAVISRPQCALLIFGCGRDSALWERVNRGGTTAFIEDDPKWREAAQAKLETAPVYLVSFGTKRTDWPALLYSPDRLALDLPPMVSSRRWDVILVDGPAGHDDSDPGRMKSIYAASKLVAPGGCVFVHDCERPVEQQFAARYLGSGRLFVQARGRAVLNGYAF